MEIADKIFKIESAQPGPTVMVIAGTHGEERAGIMALLELIPSISITKGTLFMAFSNPEADKLGVRFTGKNMNRCFYEGNAGKDYEDRRARQLMKVFDTCDALLDLHSFGDKDGEAFAICEDNALQVAVHLEPNIIITNWTSAQPNGTDSYMWFKGKVGIGVECGPNSQSKKYKKLAIKVIEQFLGYYGMRKNAALVSTASKRIFEIRMGVQRTDEHYYLDPALQHLQQLHGGQVLGFQGDEKYIAKAGDFMIFPRTDPIIGSQAFLLARLISTKL